ncbi:MAG: acyl-CoA thioesterase [Saprospiraceae bacterium]
MKEKTTAESKTIMTEMIMPNDTNPLGNLMGGNLMRWMDICSSICAAKHCETYVVTASVDHVSFSNPIHNGDVITLSAVVTRVFNTSLEVYVEVVVSDITGNNSKQSNHAYFTFVALDTETKKPVKAPKLRPVTTEEKRLYDGASRRRELRLILSGRIKPEDATEIIGFFSNM